jgi:NDP-sugar pyrophosphorylase family protein
MRNWRRSNRNGTVGKIENNKVVAYTFPPPPPEELDEDHLRDMSLWGINKGFYDYARSHQEVGLISELLQQAVADNEYVAGNLHEGKWIHLGYPEDLRKSMR